MESNWDYCLKAVLLEEGGNDDDPHDPGGRTSRGIIQREYNAYREYTHKPTQDVWKASDDEVADIYKHQDWMPYCPKMPSGIDLVYYDMCVNAGPVQATKLLQRCLHVNDDGHVGIVTMGAIEDIDDNAVVPFIKAYSQRRLTFYRGLKGAKYYIRGWTNRTNTIQSAAIALANRPAQILSSRISDDSQSP